jgi:hypothetical protein
MALINFQSALYFAPKPPTAELLARLRAAVPAVGKELGIDLRALDDANAAILAGDDEQFEALGRQLFLLYDEERRFYDTNEWMLQISVLDDYSQASALNVLPELTEATRELTNFVWNRLVQITRALVVHSSPVIAQINGLDEEVGGQVISPKTVEPGRLPEFLTPYTYLDDSIGEPLARAAEAADAYRVERLPSGWAVQLVQDFYHRPSLRLLDAVREVYGTRSAPYEQTPVFEDVEG